MSEVWLAVHFSDRGSNDPSIILGAYETRDEAVGTLKEEFDGIKYVIDENDSNSTFKTRHDWIGQAMKLNVGKRVNIDV